MPRRPLLVTLVAVGLAGGAAVPWLLASARTLEAEADALRGRRAPAAATIDSLVGLTDSVRGTLVRERIRAASRAEPTLHLELERDAGVLRLVRDGIVLRRMAVRIAGTPPEAGVRTLAQLTETVADTTPVVDTLGVPVPAARRTAPATVDRLVLDDGAVLRAGDASAALVPATDASPSVATGRALVVARRDLAAIRPNLVRGMKVFAW